MPNERLAADTLILLSGPRSIINSSVENNSDPNSNTSFKINHRTFRELVEEYRSIYRLISSLVPASQLIIDDNPYGETDCNGQMEQLLPYNLKALPFRQLPHGPNRAYYLRDAHVYVNGLFIPNEGTWSEKHLPFESALGEGGAVLSRQDLIIPTAEILYLAEEVAESVEARGFRFGVLMPRAANAPEVFAEHHIDAHALLVEDKSNNLNLITTRAYHDQDEQTQFSIAQTTEINEIALHIVEDEIPMGLNAIQLDDRSIAMTSGAPNLEALLKGLVGSRNVHTTDRPIRVIPEQTHAGIRCLTNVIPRYVLDL